MGYCGLNEFCAVFQWIIVVSMSSVQFFQWFMVVSVSSVQFFQWFLVVSMSSVQFFQWFIVVSIVCLTVFISNSIHPCDFFDSFYQQFSSPL